MADIKQITLPSGTTYNLVDAGARQLIETLGNALYWMGVTTTELTDGSTTNPVQINSESVTANLGGMAQYSGEEFVWNGSAWQSLGKNNFGDLAFEDEATGTFTPVGSVSKPDIDVTPSTESISGIDSVGTLPSAVMPSFTVSGEILIIGTSSFNPGTLPTLGTSVNVLTGVTAELHETPTFTGTAGSVTVRAPETP